MEEDKEILQDETNVLGLLFKCAGTKKYKQAIENILNRLEQDERVINNATTHLEYYLLGNSRFEDSQEEFSKLLKMLKRD